MQTKSNAEEEEELILTWRWVWSVDGAEMHSLAPDLQFQTASFNQQRFKSELVTERIWRTNSRFCTAELSFWPAERQLERWTRWTRGWSRWRWSSAETCRRTCSGSASFPRRRPPPVWAPQARWGRLSASVSMFSDSFHIFEHRCLV